MNIDASSHYPCTPEKLFQHVRMTKTLNYVSHPLLKFKPKTPEPLPEIWQEKTYWVSMYLFGFIPIGEQAIVITYPEKGEKEKYAIRDNGFSSSVKRWDHTLTITPTDNGCLYHDHMELEAGILTPIIGAFANYFYKHRQRQIKKLVENNFDFPLSNS